MYMNSHLMVPDNFFSVYWKSNIIYIFFFRASLRQIIERRIGLETYTDKLTQIPKYECYTKAAKKPHLNSKQASDVIFDYEFTSIFKSMECK